jgi:hypothetical protein
MAEQEIGVPVGFFNKKKPRSMGANNSTQTGKLLQELAHERPDRGSGSSIFPAAIRAVGSPVIEVDGDSPCTVQSYEFSTGN